MEAALEAIGAFAAEDTPRQPGQVWLRVAAHPAPHVGARGTARADVSCGRAWAGHDRRRRDPHHRKPFAVRPLLAPLLRHRLQARRQAPGACLARTTLLRAGTCGREQLSCL